MRHVVYKYFSIGAYEKEEKWLNEMSAKGMQLVDVSFGIRYVFEEGMSGEYIYRLELLENLPSNVESTAYLHFLEETGVEHVASYLRWVYLRKKASDGDFEIYSDTDSKIKHYKRICTFANIMSILELVVAIIYFWDAHNQYMFYTKGFYGKSYHVPYITGGIVFLIIFFFIQIIIIPIRKSMHQLKSQKKISE